MDIKYKIKLIEILRLRPADLDVLDSVILSDSCLEAITEQNLTKNLEPLPTMVIQMKRRDWLRQV